MTDAFWYRAARADGRLVSGQVRAAGQAQATTLLRDSGLEPLTITPAPAPPTARPATRRELAVVLRSIAALVAAGVPLERAVGATEPLARGPLQETLQQARRRLHEGAGLANALASGNGVLPPVVTGMLGAGERGGQLGRALDQAATQLEREAELIGRVRQALAYPAVLAVVGTASVLLIATTIVPRFAVLLADAGSELPWSARLLVGVSDFVTHNALLLGMLGFGAVAAVSAWGRTARGQLVVARRLLDLPMVGPLRRSLATARWGRALGSMLHTGMPLLPALSAARDAVADPAVGERLERAQARVAEGQGLTPSLEREAAVAPSALQVLAVGESTGAIGRMAEEAGDLAAAEAERALSTLVTLLEPALVVVFGGIVAFVAAALLQAVYSLRPT